MKSEKSAARVNLNSERLRMKSATRTARVNLNSVKEYALRKKITSSTLNLNLYS